MGFFSRKAPPEPKPGPVEHPTKPDLSSLWTWSSMVLAASPESLVYSGKKGMRGVDLRGGSRWQHVFVDEKIFSDHLYGRVEDRVLVAGATGVSALDLATGELCWELPHPARLHRTPILTGDELLLTFADRTWYRLAARDGEHRAEGQVTSDDDVRKLAGPGVELLATLGSSIAYGGSEVSIWGELRVDASDVTTGPRGPTPGKYPIDGWQAGDAVGLVAGKLAVALNRKWGEEKQLAIGLFEATSLEPLRLVKLGRAESPSARVVDDTIVVRADVPTGGGDNITTHFVVDAERERLLARLPDGRSAEIFDPDGRTVWTGAL
jgi:hypothetical protein